MKRRSFFVTVMLLSLSVLARAERLQGPEAQIFGFVENKGQIKDQNGAVREDIDFVFSARDMTIFIGKGQMHYLFTKTVRNDKRTVTSSPAVSTYRLDVSLAGADINAKKVAEDKVKTKLNYYNAEAIDVNIFRKITYKNIYAGIDWVLYTKGKELKYDFIIHPGAKPDDIKLLYAGADSLKIASNGDLKVATPYGIISEHSLYVYEQESKRQISATYRLNGNSLSFDLDNYDGTAVVDPGVDWATYFGGGMDEYASKVVCDSHGYIYMSGVTSSAAGIATTGAHQVALDGLYNAYIAKFDSTGNLIWATYYGGAGSALGGYIVSSSLACDKSGNIYLAGTTEAENGIATPGSFQETKDPGSFYNGFIVKFNTDGTRSWGTYYGASTVFTWFYAVACDNYGNVYVAGSADSSTSTTGALVTSGAHQVMHGGASYDNNGLLVKFDSAGVRKWASYYGGNNYTVIYSVICDRDSSLYICGEGGTANNDVGTPGTFQPVATVSTSGFLAKFNLEGKRIWGSYLNGTGHTLVVDSFHHLYVAGYTATQNDPMVFTSGGYQQNTSDADNYFLMQFNPLTGSRNWGTYYGGEHAENSLTSLACDHAGKIYFSGVSNSRGTLYQNIIATPGSYQDTLNADPDPSNTTPPADAFVAQFDTLGKRVWATYYGGPGEESSASVACSPDGALYMAGTTVSKSAIATPGSFQDTFGGSFLVRFVPVDIVLEKVIDQIDDTVCAGLDFPLSLQVSNQGKLRVTDTIFVSAAYTGPSSGLIDSFYTAGLQVNTYATVSLGAVLLQQAGRYKFEVYLHSTAGDGNRNNDTISFELTVAAEPDITGIETTPAGTTYTFAPVGALGAVSYNWDFGDGTTAATDTVAHSYKESGSYIVRLIIANECGADTAYSSLNAIGTTHVESAEFDKNILVYPNPANNSLTVKCGYTTILRTYTILNSLGSIVLEGHTDMHNSIKTGQLSPGSYVLLLNTDKGVVKAIFQVVR